MPRSNDLPPQIQRTVDEAKAGVAFPRLLCPPMSGQGWLYCCREGCAWWDADHRECAVVAIAKRIGLAVR